MNIYDNPAIQYVFLDNNRFRLIVVFSPPDPIGMGDPETSAQDTYDLTPTTISVYKYQIAGYDRRVHLLSTAPDFVKNIARTCIAQSSIVYAKIVLGASSFSTATDKESARVLLNYLYEQEVEDERKRTSGRIAQAV